MAKIKTIETKHGVCRGVLKVLIAENDICPPSRECFATGSLKLNQEPTHSSIAPGEWIVTLFSPKALPDGRRCKRTIKEVLAMISDFGVPPNVMALAAALNQGLYKVAMDFPDVSSNVDVFFLALGTACPSPKGCCNLCPYFCHPTWKKEKITHSRFFLLAENVPIPRSPVPVFLTQEMCEKLGMKMA